MVELRCEAVRWADDEPFPGVVEVQFTDAAGRCWSLFDKAPVFDSMGELGPDSTFPVEVAVTCVVAEGHGLLEDEEAVTVSTSPHGVATFDGREEFTVRRDQLIH
ncbi:hypothetical protein [Streptomyces nigrescens]|uniref:Uncharacterized protein n=1 Tax=Streptomyces nigrescens TaxID=1920 RepID=A0A640TA44_STRNI|nr:hypothetical protein [Streptomyces libani]WAT95402.1 hypothetical protein STRLI_001116 [Streptomyces libani subsp. libani]GFE20619.1 hypothetical protein Sliba_10720 [Streptomyces libani subsp. libani]GGV87628.1 hypothetical protein GCM10010500_08160 [Streptomyces libani subsp. libani]